MSRTVSPPYSCDSLRPPAKEIHPSFRPRSTRYFSIPLLLCLCLRMVYDRTGWTGETSVACQFHIKRTALTTQTHFHSPDSSLSLSLSPSSTIYSSTLRSLTFIPSPITSNRHSFSPIPFNSTHTTRRLGKKKSYSLSFLRFFRLLINAHTTQCRSWAQAGF